MMKSLFSFWVLAAISTVMISGGCTTQTTTNSNTVSSTTPSPSPSFTSSVETTAAVAPVTLPVLNALFSDENFKSELKSKAKLTDEQINSLQQSASDEIARLRQSNAEEQTGSAAEARERATEAIRKAVGEEKTKEILSFVNDHWARGTDEADSVIAKAGETTALGPNAVPKDTRIVVNIPAFRMDLFRDGSLVKSYKIGIGYPEFPLPVGMRKAQQIIFNPTWTPPDEPWVKKMKNVSVGERIEAGSSLNPLGPIKIPIGQPSLIHGGKPPAKIGTFASHGCVGLTTPQVKDFSKLLAKTAGTELSDKTMETYLLDKTKTKVVKLDKPVPVELRYETIVVEDGKLHIYKDVYDQNANTEENLRAVFAANGLRFEDLNETERAEVLEALNAMSSHPKPASTSTVTNTNDAKSKQSKAEEKKSRVAQKSAKNQKERVIELAALAGKGYPAPVDFDLGTGKPGVSKAAL